MQIQRIQTGVRLEKRLVNTLNRLAKQADQTFGELVEEMVLHAFEGNGACAWMPKALTNRVAAAKTACGLDACYSFDERDGPVPGPADRSPVRVERTQMGFKIEKRMLRVLKAIAELYDAKLGHVIEEIALHQMEGNDAFGKKAMEKIELLKQVYDMDYDTHASYEFVEEEVA